MNARDIHNKVAASLAALDNLPKAKANPALLERILQQAAQPAAAPINRSWQQLAAAVALLVALNVFSAFYSYRQTVNNTQLTDNGYVTDYFITLNY